MKMKNSLELTRIGLLVSLLLLILITGLRTFASIDDISGIPIIVDAPESHTRPHVNPPLKSANGEKQKLEVLTRTEPRNVVSYEIYFDKFIIWTTDTAETIEIIANSHYIQDVIEDEKGLWAITVYTEDPDVGRDISETLNKNSCTVRLENYVYTTQGGVLWPTSSIGLCLKELSDSVRMKEIADSLGLELIEPYSPSFRDEWSLKLTSKTRMNRPELVKLFQDKMNLDYCQLEWGGGLVIQDFTYDPLITRQWTLYNLENVSIPNIGKYTDIDISRAWNLASGRGARSKDVCD